MPVDHHKGWYTVRKIPHFDAAHTLQFVTFRLGDSLPQSVLRELNKEIHHFPAESQEYTRRKRIEYWLDQGLGCCALRHPEMATVMTQTLAYYHGQRYQLIAWSIMPNHVHVIIEPHYSLPRIVQSWKSYSARWAMQHAKELELPVSGQQLWMRGYWDRYIRDAKHLQAAVHYVHQNPVKAGLCAQAEEWPWSSAYAGDA